MTNGQGPELDHSVPGLRTIRVDQGGTGCGVPEVRITYRELWKLEIHGESRDAVTGTALLQPFRSFSQVLVQGCLLDPSQREVFLQQVYEQLCLFEDKVATMLQQQYDPQNQVCERESRWKPLRKRVAENGEQREE